MNTLALRVQPAGDHVVVRDPVTCARLSGEGATVPNTAYWRRRIKDGDVVPMAAGAAEPTQMLEG